MSTTTIQERFTDGDGALLDVTSVLARDPTNAYGVRRTDTLAAVQDPGTPFIRQSLGVYTLTFTDPAPGLVYNYWVEFVYQGQTYRFEKQRSETAGPAGYYTSKDEMVAREGTSSIVQWSNKSGESSTAANDDLILDALTKTDTEIDAMLRARGYTAPLPTTSADFGFVADQATDLACARLYRPRGEKDKEGELDGKMSKAADGARRRLRMLFSAGGLDCPRRFEAPAMDVA